MVLFILVQDKPLAAVRGSLDQHRKGASVATSPLLFFSFKVKCIYFPLVSLHSVLCLWALFRFVLLLGAGYERLQKR